uniref:Integrase catalytic domain-containing protein n=1 Tax=Fagus sylvatica TaxID=28930 RepID=A0A2N9HU83_FAGSY
MTQEFYKKFFPPHKVQQVKRKISSFIQGNDETLFMAWERFKDTYNFCPTNGYDTWRLLRTPTPGMDQVPLDSTDGNRSSATTSGGSIFKLRKEDNLSAKINLLTKEIEALKLKGSRGVNTVFREEPMEACRICQEIDHTTSDCKSLSQFLNVPEEQSDNVLNPPPPRNNFVPSSSSSRPPLEDVLGTFMQKQSEQSQRFEIMFTRMDEEAKEKSKETQAEKDESGTPKVKEVGRCPIPTPFPQALRLPKNLDVTTEILEHLHQVKVNLPLLHIIKQMPTYAKVIKDLCTVKRKHHLKKTAFLTEQVSDIIQHKVLPKYKNPGCPTISCTIGEYLVKRALLDLRASINLLSFTVYQQMGLGDLKPTSITLQLVDRSVRTPKGMVEDVLIKIENFYYPVDFIILDTEPTLHLDNGILIILGRPFLATANTLINCRNERMKITFGSTIAEFNIFNVMQQQLEDDECHYVNLIDTVVQEEFNRNCLSDPLETLLTNSVDSYDIAHDAHLTEICSLLDSSQVLEVEQVMVINEPWRPHFKKLPKTERKPMPSSEEIPQLELKPLPNGFKYAYLGPGETFLVVISTALNEEQEARCVEKGLVLNWEKCHFMVTSGIVLGHVVSSKGIEVDKAKVDLILNLPTPKTVRDVRSFLGHVGFYRRFIRDFSSISRPLCNLLLKKSTFEWTESCEVAFKKLVQLLTSAPIMQAPDWSLPFEIMCDASDYVVGAVLGQRKDKKPHVIHYASQTLNNAQMNYTTTEKELYLLSKNDAKARLIRWILLLQKFNIEIKDKKGMENVVADHLSRLTFEEVKEEISILDAFPDEQLFAITELPWYAHIVNYLVTGSIPETWTTQDRRKFFVEVRNFYWDDPYLFKYCPDQILRRCIPDNETLSVIKFCHTKACGGHFSVKKTTAKILQCGFYWPTMFKDTYSFCKGCLECQKLGRVTRRNMMLMSPILKIEVFYCWGIDFMGPFPQSFGNLYILLAIDYASKWVEASACKVNDHKVMLKFFREHIFSRFGMLKAVISDNGKHFCNRPFEVLVKKYGVVSPNRKDWSLRLTDALWAYQAAYKGPLGMSPYRLVYGKPFHLPIEMEHRAYWAIKAFNFDLKEAGELRKFPNKTRWDGPYIVKEVFDYGAVVIEDPRDGRILKVNGQRLRPYLGEVVLAEETMSLELPTYGHAS